MAFQAIMAGAQIAATIANGVDQYKSYKTAAKGFKQQAAIDRINAGKALSTGNKQAQQLRKYGNKVKGTQAAIFAANGIAFQGSAVDALEETAELAELDALMAKYNGETQAISLNYQAAVNSYQAKLAKKAARETLIGTFIGAGALTGAHMSQGGALRGAYDGYKNNQLIKNSGSFFKGGFAQ